MDMLRQSLKVLEQMQSNVVLAVKHYRAVSRHPVTSIGRDNAWEQVLASLDAHKQVYELATSIMAMMHRTYTLDQVYAIDEE